MLTFAETEPCTIEPLWAALAEAQTRYQLFPKPTPGTQTTVVVGVSGGADSICLLHSLVQLRQSFQVTLHVAHLDHNLRPESEQDGAFVAQLAADWGLPFSSQRLDPGVLKAHPGGLEAAARQARYTFLAQVAINVTAATQVPVIALGHHADDQAETVLLHLVRGSGLRGLGGMQWVSEQPLTQFVNIQTQPNPARGVRLVRPLLAVRKTAILEYMQAHGLPWREDQSNATQQFVRNQLRHEVLPRLAAINPAIVETVGRLADTLAAEQVRIEQFDRQQLSAVQIRHAPLNAASSQVRVVLDLAGLLALDLASQRGVLRQALARFTAQLHDVEFAQVERLRCTLHKNSHTQGPHPIGQGLAWSVAGATLTQPARLSLHQADALPFQPDHPYLHATWQAQIGSTPLPLPGKLCTDEGWHLQVTVLSIEQLPVDWQAPGQPWRAYLDAAQVGRPHLTTTRAGLHFAPLGMAGQHKLLGNFFTDRKIPPSLRSGWPLLIDSASQSVLWVCGLAIAHQVRITEQTRQVLCIQWLLE